MEQFVFMNDVLALLEERGVNVVFRKVGNFMTSLDMQGLSNTDRLDGDTMERFFRKQCTDDFMVKISR